MSDPRLRAIGDAINAHMHPGSQCPGAGALGECAAIDLEGGRHVAYLYLWDKSFNDSARVASWFEALGATGITISLRLHDPDNDVFDGVCRLDGVRSWDVGFSLEAA